MVGKPKGCASLGVEDIPDGPTTFRELFLWNSDVVDRLRLEHSNQQKPWVQKEFTISLTSSYSGLGMAEIAANFVSHAFLKHGVKVHVNSYAQTEKDDACKKLLGANHIFSDLLERVSPGLLKRLTAMQDRRRAKQQQNGTEMLAASNKFLQAAVKMMNSAKQDEFLSCAKCINIACRTDAEAAEDQNHTCSWRPPRKPGQLWVETGGNTRTPFSKRGKGLMWLDPQSLPCLVWAFSLKRGPSGGPDALVDENVPGFDAEAFFRMVWPGAHICSETFSPCDLGIPAHRPRKYSLDKLSSTPKC